MGKLLGLDITTEKEEVLDVWYIQVEGVFGERAVMNCKILGTEHQILFPVSIALAMSTHLAAGKTVGFTYGPSGEPPIGGVPVGKYEGRVTLFQ